MDNTEKFINHLSLCSGYSGIGIGLKQVLPNVREIVHVEVEAYAVANLVEKMEKGLLVPAPIWSDLKTFNFSAFRESLEYGILSAGFPCQPFSQAGRRKATKDPRHLWPYIIDGIRQCNPMFCFLENVQGIISAKTGDGESVLKYVCGELEQEGYRVATGIFSASEVGAPHQRKRVFILANTTSTRLEGRKRSELQGHKHRFTSTSKNQKLANANSEGLQGRQLNKAYNRADCEQTRPHGPITQRSFSKTNKQQKMDNADNSRSWENFKQSKLWATRTKQSSECTRVQSTKGKITQGCKGQDQSKNWPANPEQKQHDWEETRTTPKSQLGGATNGPSSGVDANTNRIERLTLCGNGVVPQTAALAFVTLLEKLEKMNVEINSDV